MADLESEFQKAVDDVRKLKSKPDQKELLKLYALFKQATLGTNDKPAPSVFDLVGKAKHEAWKNLGDLSKDEAKKQYISEVQQLISRYGLQE